MPFPPFAGLLISLEGIDGTGKSTLQRLLAGALERRGWVVCCSREPTDGPEGSKLRAAAQAHQRLSADQELVLLLADRQRHLSQRVLPALARGEAVLLDRYYHSTAAYQGAAGLDPAQLIAVNERFAPRPQLVVVLDLPSELALERIGLRGTAIDAFERLDNLERARRIFAALSGPTFLHLDARQSPQQSLVQILDLLEQRRLLDPATAQPAPATTMAGDPHYAPAATRNAAPILTVLKAELADSPRKLLEVGSGTGQHALQFSAALPQVHWQCSEVADALPLLAQRLGQAGLGNLPQPIELDVAASAWPTTTYDAIYSANTLHIMRWREVERFFAGATRALKPGGKLLVYGPYHRCGQPTSDGNRDFDASLRRDDPERGIRDTADMDTLAAHHDLQLDADIPMPANNALRVWVKNRAEG